MFVKSLVGEGNTLKTSGENTLKRRVGQKLWSSLLCGSMWTEYHVCLVWGLEWGVGSARSGGRERAGRPAVGVGRGCEAARVLCVPEVQAWLGGMECSLLPSKSRSSCGIA